MAVGDVVNGINRFGGTGTFEFRPAAGVEICITMLGNRGGTWNGLVSVANPVSGNAINNISATGSYAYAGGKLFITNDVWLGMVENVTYDNSYSGIQIK